MASHIIAHDIVLKVAGQRTFDQGKQDFDDQLISNFQSEGDVVRAKFGEYETSVRYKNESVEGSCTCPDSDGFEFCRHCVALTLHANKMTQQLFALSKGPDKSKIFAYLLQLDKQDLAKQFLNVIDQDEQLKKKFLLKASLGSQKIDYSALRSQVTQITKVDKQLFSQRQVKHFFARIESFLEEILDYGHYEEPEKMAKIVEYCLSRINKLLRTLDDSNNQRENTTSLLRQLYSNLLQSLPEGTEQTVKRFYRHWLTDEYALLGNELVDFFAHDEEVATKQFDRLIDQSWVRQQKVQGKPAGCEQSDTELEPWQVEKLAHYQLEQAKANHDIGAEISLRALMAKTLDDHLTLAERLHEKGDLTQAIRSAKNALSIAPHSQIALEFLVGLMELKNDLIDPFIELFEQYPDQVLDTLIPYAERHGKLQETLDKCIEVLQQKLPEHSHELAVLLLKRERLEDATQLAETHSLKVDDLVAIADANAQNDIPSAITLYQKAIHSLVERGLNKSYEQAVSCLHEMMPLAGGKDADQFVDYVERLAIQHRSKAPFIQMLKQSFQQA